jgi:Protein of unknown function (DUF1573)
MQKILTCLLAAIVISACQHTKTEKTTQVRFDKDTLNLGIIKKNDFARLEFYFKNTGTEDLHIVNVGAECGCTKPEFEEKAVKPGDSSAIFAVYSSKKDSGRVLRSLVLEANTVPKLKVLYFTAEVQ